MRDMLEACDVPFESDEEYQTRFNDMDKDKVSTYELRLYDFFRTASSLLMISNIFLCMVIYKKIKN